MHFNLIIGHKTEPEKTLRYSLPKILGGTSRLIIRVQTEYIGNNSEEQCQLFEV